MQKYLVCFLFFAVTVFNLNAQTRIEGITKNNIGVAIPFVTLTVNYTDTNKVSVFGFSDATGKFSIKINDSIATCTVNASLLGFAKARRQLVVQKKQINTLDFILIEEAIDIKSLTIRAARPPVKTRPDTTTFQVKRFIDSSERVVEDVLKKLPGMSVDENGGIKFQGRAIERILIEGDDLFNRDYKIPSKNLSANVIEEVQVIDRYSSNPLLKKLENSERLVINLNFKKERIKRWFGNVNAGGGIESKYDASWNLITFSKKLKLFNLGNFNNVGNDASPELSSDRIMNQRQNADFYDPEVRAKTLINSLLLGGLIINRERYNFNNAAFSSLNFIDKPSDKFQIKGIAAFYKDAFTQNQNATTQYLLGKQSFLTTDTQSVQSKPIYGKANVELTYRMSEASLLIFSSEVSSKKTETDGATVLNATGFAQNLNDKFTYWKHLLNVTKKINDSLALVFHATYSNDAHTQTFLINPSQKFTSLFALDSNVLNSTLQNSDIHTQFLGFEGQVLGVLQNDKKLSVKFGGSLQTDDLLSNIDLFLNNSEKQNASNAFNNNLTYKETHFFARTDFTKDIGNISFTGLVGINSSTGNLKNYLNDSSNYNKNWIYPDFTVRAKWTINYANKISASYKFNENSADVNNVYDGYILNSYNNFTRNTVAPTQIASHSTIFLYNYNDDFKNIWGFLSTSYSRSENGWSSRQIYSPFYTLTSRVNASLPNENIVILGEVSKLASKINLSFKLSTQQLWFINYTSVGSENFSKSTNWSAKYGGSLVSTYSGFFNFSLGGNWNRNINYSILDSQKNSPSSKLIDAFLRLKFNWSGKTFFFFTNNLYYSQSDFKENPKHIFTDFEFYHTFIPQKLNFSLEFKNIFNVTEFVTTSVGVNQSSLSAYKLVPRFVIGKLEWRF